MHRLMQSYPAPDSVCDVSRYRLLSSNLTPDKLAQRRDLRKIVVAPSAFGNVVLNTKGRVYYVASSRIT